MERVGSCQCYAVRLVLVDPRDRVPVPNLPRAELPGGEGKLKPFDPRDCAIMLELSLNRRIAHRILFTIGAENHPLGWRARPVASYGARWTRAPATDGQTPPQNLQRLS